MKGTLKGAAVGALIASAAALLLAPQSGKKTQAQLTKIVEQTKKDMQKKFKKAELFTRDEYEHVFLNAMAQAAKKKQEAALLISDVSAILKSGWDEMKREMKNVPSRQQSQGKKK
ncbi:YtxH domain-containing protein [Candidatus Uhrbacteria bacterium]|nr:YtxH domain-containing protein [Candidatus Uhrbacteria bacterium]